MIGKKYEKTKGRWLRDRFLVLMAIGLTLWGASYCVKELITERHDRQKSTQQGIYKQWGGDQVLGGPVLTVPYTHFGKKAKETRFAHFLPERYQVTGELVPEVRKRSIYKCILYSSELTLEGAFDRRQFSKLNIPLTDFHWDKAFISIGISDIRGIKESVRLDFDNQTYPLNQKLINRDVYGQGVYVPIDLTQHRTSLLSFKSEIKLSGSQTFQIIPVGNSNHFSIRSDWPDPNFIGHFLPGTKEITEEGFTSEWRINGINNRYDNQFVGSKDIESSAAGVELLLMVDNYQKIERSIKYALLFVLLMFGTYFALELVFKQSFNYLNYGLSGAAIVLFYLLLLSLSEHISFGVAYWIASLATISMVSLYTHGVLKNKQSTIVIFAVLTLLYGFFFQLLSLQSYSLVFGSIGLFVMLGILMYVTKDIRLDDDVDHNSTSLF